MDSPFGFTEVDEIPLEQSWHTLGDNSTCAAEVVTYDSRVNDLGVSLHYHPYFMYAASRKINHSIRILPASHLLISPF